MTKKLKLLFVVCFVSIALGLSAGKAHAASIATSTAGLQVTGVTGNPFYNSAGSFSVALAATDVPAVFGPSVDIQPWPLMSNAQAGVPFLLEGIAGTDPVLGNIGSLAHVGPIPNPGLAFSAAGFFYEITATAQGIIGISAVDILSLDLFTDSIGEVASGFAIAGAFVVNLTTLDLSLGNVLDYDLVFGSVGNGDDFLFSTPGFNTLTAWTGFGAGHQGIMGAFVATGVDTGILTKPIPEPTTMALFGIGLVGLVGAGARKKLKKKADVKS